MTFIVQRRDGLYSLQKTARLLCKYIVIFGPTIRKLYPSNTTLHDALDTAMAACTALEQAVTAEKDLGV